MERGRHAIAVTHFDSAFEFLVGVNPDRDDIHPRALAQVEGQIASAFAGLGAYEDAEAAFAPSLDLLAAHPYPLAKAAVLNDYGALLVELGSREEARDQLEQARELVAAFDVGEPISLTAMIDFNIGALEAD